MAKVLGIDLGTTNSCMAVIEVGEPQVLENTEGARTSPSVVGINDKTEERYVGLIAKRQAITNPNNTVFSIKRLMGRRFEDKEVQSASGRLPYKVVKAKNGDAHVEMAGKAYSPAEISAMILQKLKQDAEAKLGETISQAVITVPAYFDDTQRQATKDAGKVAGLDVLRIINEPTAASMAYGLDKKEDQTIAVYDLGGGTFDISILEIGEGVFEVKSTNGDTFLGGDDFDERIIDWISEEFKREQGIDLKQDRMALQRLKEAAEKAKIELSTVMQAEVNLPFITADASGPKHLAMTLSRSKMEQLVSDLVDRTVGPCKQAIADAGVALDKVDEVVAAGAAIQAGVLQGDVRDMLLVDVTPLTLGIETLGGVMTPLITRNTAIPTAKTETFTTAGDNQPSVEVHVLQGERPMASDNKSIGRFMLDGILPAPRGMPQIEVTFDINSDGILNVSAKDKATDKEQRITITASSGLSQEEIDRLIEEGSRFAEEDRQRRAEVEIRNGAESLAYSSEKLVSEHSDKISEESKTEISDKVAQLREALNGDDSTLISSVMEELQAIVQRIGSELYSASAEEGGTDPTDTTGSQDDGDGTIEGEYKEV